MRADGFRNREEHGRNIFERIKEVRAMVTKRVLFKRGQKIYSEESRTPNDKERKSLTGKKLGAALRRL